MLKYFTFNYETYYNHLKGGQRIFFLMDPLYTRKHTRFPPQYLLSLFDFLPYVISSKVSPFPTLLYVPRN